MLLTGATILPMDAPQIARGYVHITQGKIRAVGPVEQAPAPEDGEEVLDLAGKLVLPGYIDAHSHLGLEEDSLGFEGDDVNEVTDPVTPHVRALDGINPFDRCFAEARGAGITCAVIAPGSANPIGGQICAVKTAGRWIDRMIVAQPLAMKFAMGENPKKVYAPKSKTPGTRMGTVALIRDALCQARRYGEELDRNGRDQNTALPKYDARLEALLPVLRREMRAHFHAHRAYDILSAVRIAQEFHLEYTLVHCTEGHLIADILAEIGASVICGPLLHTRSKPELSNMTILNCGKLMRAGVPVAVCTDHPVVPSDALPLSAALAGVAGLPRDKALESITITAARAVGLDNRLGSITPGKDADLLVFGGDPLSLGAKPELVLIDGRTVR